jgi:hypothetical protein
VYLSLSLTFRDPATTLLLELLVFFSASLSISYMSKDGCQMCFFQVSIFLHPRLLSWPRDSFWHASFATCTYRHAKCVISFECVVYRMVSLKDG